MIQMIYFFQHDAEGNIVSSGNAATDEEVALYAKPSLTLRIGHADPRTDYYDTNSNQVRRYSDETIAMRSEYPGHGFRWSLGQWIDERSLPQAKEQKWNEIKRARIAAEFGTFLVGGYEFDCDKDSQTRINSAFQSAMDARINGEPFSIDWTLSDDTNVTLARAQVIAVGRALQAHVNAVFDKSRQLRAQIVAATTKEELDGISW